MKDCEGCGAPVNGHACEYCGRVAKFHEHAQAHIQQQSGNNNQMRAWGTSTLMLNPFYGTSTRWV